MIFKTYQINKLDLELNKIILFYGKNEGHKKEEISKIKLSNKNKQIHKYDEKQILENENILYEEIFSKSLFDSEKLIIINRASDKIFKLINEIITRQLDDILLIINADVLEKRSKLRTLFEKEKNLACIPFYPDTHETLVRMSFSFFNEKKIPISQSNINLIVNRSNGDRETLKNELKKIELYSYKDKKITSENILKLTNLIENYSISELIDNCLIKNEKKTIHILNENNFNHDDCIIITRVFLSKLKRILNLSEEFKKNKNLDKTISNAKPPIFWKEKEITKQQVIKWSPEKLKKIIFRLVEIELLIKKNIQNSINLITDFIIEQSSNN